ncbi:MAG: ATP cone domain-containing protein, partial [Candidatus Magasanikbacteria bacterium]|nr:ATP cone domain-containing protein [Candidatus Magasanikbacteria bacterium]
MTSAKVNKITQIRKRDDRIVPFEEGKLTKAVLLALEATQEIESAKKREKMAEKVTEAVLKTLNKRFHARSIPAVEEVQDTVEEELGKAKLFKTAKAYILYRDQRAKVRDMQTLINSDELIDGYLNQLDWRVKENSNMSYSLQGLNNHVASAVSSHYWLNRIYPQEVRDAHANGDLHMHDLQLLSAYCCGWDLKEILLKGFGGVSGKIESKPPKHFRTALGQLVNFFYTLQGETAGAQAVSSFDTLLAPFIRFDKLSYDEVKQGLQEFLFNMNVPTRVGFQTPFTNIT